MVDIRFLLHCAIWATVYNGALSWVPPHPDSNTVEWESVHDMRRRLRQPYNYTTKIISDEICRFISEEECEEADKSMVEHAAAHRKLQNPNLGTIPVNATRAAFSDHVGRDLVAKADVEEFWNTKMTAWFNANSQGRYTITTTVVDWMVTDNTEIYYSMGMRGIVPDLQKMAWPILDELDSRPDWDWSQYDSDADGSIDSLVMIHSGYGAETTTTDCFGTDFNDRIWAHAYSTSRAANSWFSADESIRVRGYTVASALDGDCGSVPAKIGLTAHEYMHTLGLEDLYDGVDPLAASGVGAFDIMADPYGQNGDADNPGHLSAWSKVLAGWLEPTIINSSQDSLSLQAAEISDEAYRINLIEGPVAEYLLIENRQPLEFDINIWAEGLVIYHVDDAADLQMNLGYPGQEGWPENGNHYQVAVLPKDGEYHLEKGENNGDAGDFWVPGDTLGPGNDGTVFPNTDTYQGGFIMETGLWLRVLSQEGTDVLFQVGGFDGEPPPTGEAITDAPAGITAAPSAQNAQTTAPTLEKVPTQVPTTSTTRPTISPTTQIVFTETQAPTTQQAGETAIPTVPTITERPAIPTISYLDSYEAFTEKEPTNIPYLSNFDSVSPNVAGGTQPSHLSTFDSATETEALQPQTSHLSSFNSATNLRGGEDGIEAKGEGFLSVNFESLTSTAGSFFNGDGSRVSGAQIENGIDDIGTLDGSLDVIQQTVESQRVFEARGGSFVSSASSFLWRSSRYISAMLSLATALYGFGM